MRVLIAPDKLKGSLSAEQAAAAITAGFSKACPEATLTSLPVADGGDGTAEIILNASHGEWVTVTVRDPLGRPIPARYAWIAATQTAVIEMSEASGLRRLRPHELDPFHASTYGTGELIRHAADHGARRIIVTLGGSATNEGGAGMAAALGFSFMTSDGDPIDPIPANLLSLTRIRPPAQLLLPEIVAACDVTNPLLGENGATRIFGPQKGVRPEMLALLEASIENLAQVVELDLGCDHRATPGSGAAGGLGFGLLSFCDAALRSGFDLVAEAIGLEKAITVSDLVITAEGRLDRQSMNGKAPVGVAALARRHGKPVMVIAGSVEDDPRLHALFDRVLSATSKTFSLEANMANAKELFEQAAEKAAGMALDLIRRQS